MSNQIDNAKAGAFLPTFTLLAFVAISCTLMMVLRAGVAEAANVDLVAPASVEAPRAVPFSASAKGSSEVRFFVDGKQLWRAPVVGKALRRSGSLKLGTGRHALAIRAVQADGRVSVKRQVTIVRGHGATDHESIAPKPTPVTTTPTSTKNTEPTKPTSPAPITEEPPTPITEAPSSPTQTAPPTTGAASELLFDGAHINQFLNQSAPGAVTEVPDPAGSGETVFQMTVNNADVYPITPTENPRAELVSPQTIQAGAEFWASMKFYLPSSFPSSLPSWFTLLEGPYGPPWEGSPPWHIEANGTHLQWQRNGTYNYDIPWQMNLVRGSWVHVMLHERFASNGWIEMWINGQPVNFFSGSGTYNPNHEPAGTKLMMQTMDASTNIGPNAFHLMSYRKLGMLETATVFQGPLALGTSRASVEAS